MSDLASRVRAGLASLATPAAPAMQAYMKSSMPFRGVAKPACVALLRGLAVQRCDNDALTAAAADLWDHAAYREERYVATALARRLPPAAARLTVHRDWIVTGAWWDHVDEIAPHLVGPVLRADPDAVAPVVRHWARQPDRWLRRTAIICQLGSKERTDTELLESAVESSASDGDFFIRKAIGWALRQHARTDPQWVLAFVDSHHELSHLSRHEALRHVGSQPPHG